MVLPVRSTGWVLPVVIMNFSCINYSVVKHNYGESMISKLSTLVDEEGLVFPHSVSHIIQKLSLGQLMM